MADLFVVYGAPRPTVLLGEHTQRLEETCHLAHYFNLDSVRRPSSISSVGLSEASRAEISLKTKRTLRIGLLRGLYRRVLRPLGVVAASRSYDQSSMMRGRRLDMHISITP
jgi:hypothetical protein